MSGMALARLDEIVQGRQIEPFDEGPNCANTMILRNQIVQRQHLHADLAAFRNPQPQRTTPLSSRSLLLRQILKQSLVRHRQPLLRAQCERITAQLLWQMPIAERFSCSEERSEGSLLRMRAQESIEPDQSTTAFAGMSGVTMEAPGRDD